MSRLIDLLYFEKPEPDEELLFHYTRYATALEHILERGTLKFSALKDSHDPLESDNYETSAASNASGDKEVALESLRQQAARGLQENDVVKKRAKIACFTIDSGPVPIKDHKKGCLHSRMWTQFAHAHTGVCVVFDKTAVLQEIQNSLGPHDTLISASVHYADFDSERFDVVFKRPWEGSPVPEQAVLESAGVHFFSKLEDHRDESEFRVAFWRSHIDISGNAEYLPVGRAIAGVILGKRFPSAYIPLAKDQAARFGAPVFQIGWYLGKPLWKQM